MKKKIKKGYFTGGEIGMIANQIGSLAGSFIDASNYKFDPNNTEGYTPDFTKILTGGVIGIIPELIKSSKDKKQRAAYVASATPGNYQQGGPLDVRVPSYPLNEHKRQMAVANSMDYQRGLAEKRAAAFSQPVSVLDTLLIEQGLQNNPSTNVFPPMQSAINLRQTNFHSSKSKSKDRFREMQNGGQIDDAQLSNNSFQVKDSPNITDGKYYPEYNAYLDHNEVVKDKFVFSDKLKDPRDGKSFAKKAAKLEKSTGNAQKILKVNPEDEMAKNTIKYNEGAVAALGQLQETIATIKGLRKSDTQSFAVGGWMDDPGDPPFIKLSNGLYYDKENNKFWSKDPKTGDFMPNPLSPMEVNKYGGAQRLMRLAAKAHEEEKIKASNAYAVTATRNSGYSTEPNLANLGMSRGALFTDHALRYPPDTKNFPPYALNTTDQTPNMRTATVPSVVEEELGAFPYPTADLPTSVFKRRSGKTPVPQNTQPWGQADRDQAELSRDLLEEMQNTAAADLPLQREGYIPKTSLTSTTATATPTIPGVSTNRTVDSKNVVYDPIEQKFTIGDGLQALKVASQFGQLTRGVETEKPEYDNTRITKENYDPSVALGQSNRNFQLALNSLQNSSINQNRSFANRAYVGKLNQDTDILSKYNDMNQRARTSFEERISNQRRYNVGQTVYTNDVNARNRAAYKMAVDNAFSSLGNFGKGLNAKEQGYDVLGILKTMYPEVYASIIGGKK